MEYQLTVYEVLKWVYFSVVHYRPLEVWIALITDTPTALPPQNHQSVSYIIISWSFCFNNRCIGVTNVWGLVDLGAAACMLIAIVLCSLNCLKSQ